MDTSTRHFSSNLRTSTGLNSPPPSRQRTRQPSAASFRSCFRQGSSVTGSTRAYTWLEGLSVTPSLSLNPMRLSTSSRSKRRPLSLFLQCSVPTQENSLRRVNWLSTAASLWSTKMVMATPLQIVSTSKTAIRRFIRRHVTAKCAVWRRGSLSSKEVRIAIKLNSKNLKRHEPLKNLKISSKPSKTSQTLIITSSKRLEASALKK